MLKVILIEDEPLIRKILRKAIEQEEDFTVVAECGTFAEALTQFRSCRPDVAFVDMDLAGESGMELARVLCDLDPKLKLVFATAHNEYMADAFEVYAFDYLLKPFDMERIRRTLRRLRESSAPVTEGEVAVQSDKFKEKLLLKGREQMLFINKEDILLLERLDGVTNIITAGETYQSSLSLSEFESKLDPRQFMRCHKGYIINLSCVSKVEPYGRWTYTVRLKGTNTTALMTSQNYENLKEIFE